MKQRIRTNRSTRRRSGVTSLQVVFLLPLLILFTIAIVQFGILLVAKQTLVAASTKGVRTAARGGELKDVQRTVARVLGTNRMDISRDGDVVILLEQHGHRPQVAGNQNIECRPQGPELRRGEVRVTVCLRQGGRAGRHLPNWLGSVGLHLSPSHLRCSSLAVAE